MRFLKIGVPAYVKQLAEETTLHTLSSDAAVQRESRVGHEGCCATLDFSQNQIWAPSHS
jgi:hypothetical protein